jgi:hypothetical protein
LDRISALVLVNSTGIEHGGGKGTYERPEATVKDVKAFLDREIAPAQR